VTCDGWADFSCNSGTPATTCIVNSDKTVSGCQQFGTLKIEAGGVLRHPGNGSEPVHKRVIVAENLTIESNGQINAVARGYGGGGPSLDEIDPYFPLSWGAGGGNSCCGPNGKRGGLVVLKVVDKLTLNGVITVGGGGSSATWTSGGNGGSVFIQCSDYSGQGSISAEGGNGHSWGGYGGRIAIHHKSSDFTGQHFVQKGTYKGINNVAYPQTDGTAVLLKLGSLAVSDGLVLSIDTPTTYESLELEQGGILQVNSPLCVATVNVSGGVMNIAKTGTLQVGQLTLTGGVVTNRGILNALGSLTVTGNTESEFNGTVNCGGAIIVKSGATLSHSAKSEVSSEKANAGLIQHHLELTSSTPLVESGASIVVRGRGYQNGGGVQFSDIDPLAPLNFGIGGGSSNNGQHGKGGGLVLISVSASVTVNGALRAGGTNASGGSSSSSGGNGGSIYIRSAAFGGTGELTSNGGSGHTYGGYGGRVISIGEWSQVDLASEGLHTREFISVGSNEIRFQTHYRGS
jgi:hypothetical protein